jgi:hypothetical protein
MNLWLLLAALMGPRFFARFVLFFVLRNRPFPVLLPSSVATLRARTRKGEHFRI